MTPIKTDNLVTCTKSRINSLAPLPPPPPTPTPNPLRITKHFHVGIPTILGAISSCLKYLSLLALDSRVPKDSASCSEAQGPFNTFF